MYIGDGGRIMTAGSGIIAVLEQSWADIQARHPQVPGVVMITGAGLAGRVSEHRFGHFGADRWKTADGGLPELFVAGELFVAENGISGGRRTMQTLLHEAAHGLAHVTGVQDCSRQGRYHNRRFVEFATELGLSTPTTPHSTFGFAFVTLGRKTTETWQATIAAIDAATLPFLAAANLAVGPAVRRGRAGTRVAVVCACDPPRRLSISPRQLEEASLICGRCAESFAPANDSAGAKDWPT
jgi:hypothetical protein